MSNSIVNTITDQGIWTLLSFVLITYILKSQEKRDAKQDERDKNYQKIITELTTKFENIYSAIKNIEDILNK